MKNRALSLLVLFVLLLAGFLANPARAAISVSGAKSVSTGSSLANSLTITPIASALRADLLVAQLTLDDRTASVTMPSGWTEITSIAQSGAGIQQRIYWTIRSNTEPAGYTWTFSKSVRAALILVDVTGVDTNQAINASVGAGGEGSTIVAPEVSATYPNGMLLAFFGTSGAATAIAPQASMIVPTNGKASAVSGGSGVQLALAYEQISSAGFTGVRTATGTSGNYVGQMLALTPASADVCFTDNFNRATLGTDWVTSNSKGGFNPTINTNGTNRRLQLTQNVNDQATLSVLQRYFPAAGNKVIVTFKQYAYPNGGGLGGADGIVTIFSDASVNPVAGGSGGSMGYAQYSSPGNTPGFAGGWLGVGIDEYGNFSNPSENRYLGPGARANAVAVRGPSNSFYAAAAGAPSLYANGYPYVAGSASLSPIIGSTSSIASGGGRGDLYRITIDSRVPGEQWVQVERSTDGGSTYSTTVSNFNLMSSLRSIFGSGVTLPSIPSNFWLSFSGGTGGSTNIHEIDDLQVCASKMVASTAAIDHFRFENPGTMDNCQSKAIKVTACVDAAPSCTQFTGGDVYVTLKPSGWIGGDTVKLIGGSGIIQLSQASAGTVTLDIDKTKTVWPALKNPATYASHCVVPGTSITTSCDLLVSAVSAGFGITFPSTSQVACDDSGDVLIKACSSGYAGSSKNLQFWFGYTDPGTPAAGSPVLQLSKDAWSNTVNLATSNPSSTSVPSPVAVTFDSSATAKVRVKYADVGKLTLNVRDSAATSVSGSGALIVRPKTFVVTAVTDSGTPATANPAAANATGSRFVAAGMPFKVTAEARNNCPTPAAVMNFGKESVAEGIKFDSELLSGLGLTNNPALTTISDFVFANGAGTATLSWPEVGIIKLTPRLKSGAYMSTVDVVGNQTGNIGRFFAHHFDTAVTQGCSSGALAFTYDRQPFPSLTVTAKEKNGTTLSNYHGSSTATLSFAKAVTLTDNTGKGAISAGGNPALPVLSFSSGVATLNGGDANHPLVTYSFTAVPTAPSAIGIAAADSDNSGFAGTAAGALIRSGRLWLGNAYGSERNNLNLPFALQYWNGRAFLTNTLDSCTVLAAANVALGNQQGGLLNAPIYNGPVAVSATSNGTGSITLAAPGAGVGGSVDVLLALGSTGAPSNCNGLAGAGATAAALPYLSGQWCGNANDRDPVARATFGISRNSRQVYLREGF